MALPEIIKDIDARVIRPTSTDNAIVRFDGATGQVQNSLPIINDDGSVLIKKNTDPKITLSTDGQYTIGTSLGTLNLQNNAAGSGSSIEDGNITSITFGHGGKAQAGIYCPTSGSYGTQLIFATTSSYANGTKARMVINHEGNIGIGTISPSYKLHVIGDIYADDGWLRTNNDRGWYNNTYGGGWYMTDSTYIRNYNSKTVRLDNLCLGADNNNFKLYVSGTSFFNGPASFGNEQVLTHRSSEGYCNILAGTFFRPCKAGDVPRIDGYTVSYTSDLGSNDYVKRFIDSDTGGILFPYSYWKDTYATAGDASSGITKTSVFTGYFTFRQRSPTNNSTSSPYTDYYENYRLPFPTYERTSSISYWILTTKNTSLTATYRLPYISSTSYGGGFSTSNHYVNSTQIGVNQTTQPSTTYNLYVNGNAYGTKVYGGVWNDYAEYRQSNITQPGRCVIENGDDTLSLSIERLQRGAEIVSDTFGFAIGETDTCKTPIAASGRVLAYGFEDREEFKSHIGYPVCSGPNGTVSIMTDEEEQLYPSRIMGYISAVPDYEIWGTGNVKVDGRIWIRIK